jgi:hypothetical protein
MFVAKYVGPDLSSMFAPAATKKAARDLISTALNRLLDATVAFTPIETGNLKTSWHIEGTPHFELGDATGHYTGRVVTEVPYAAPVEHGSGLWGPEHRKYLIEPHPPRRALRWLDPATGKPIFARRVWHPGSEGAHMTARAAALVDSTFATTAQVTLERTE